MDTLYILERLRTMQKKSSSLEIVAVVVGVVLVIGLILTLVSLSMQKLIPQVAVQEPLSTKESLTAPTSTPDTKPTQEPLSTKESLTAPTSTPGTKPTDEPTATAVPHPAEAGISRSNPLPFGTELRFQKWSIVITKVDRSKTAITAIQKANQFNEPPAKGNDYLLVSFKLTNISTEDKAQDTALAVDMRVTGERNILYSTVSIVPPKPLKGDLFPKGSAEGQIVFSVPTAEKNLMFRINEGLSITTEAARFIAIDNGAHITPPTDIGAIKATDIGKSRANPAKKGEVVTTHAWQVTVGEIVRGNQAAQRVKEANPFNAPPPEGHEYVLVNVHVRFIDSNDSDVATNIDGNVINITGEKQVVYDRPAVVAPTPQLDITLFPGGETDGWVVVSIPKDEQGLSLVFHPLFSLSDDDARYLALQ